MKKIYVNGETFEAEKIVKTNKDIIGYNGNVEAFAFRGVSDFTQFQLEEGFDISDDLKVDLAIVEAYESLYNESLQNALAIAEIYEMIAGGN